MTNLVFKVQKLFLTITILLSISIIVGLTFSCSNDQNHFEATINFYDCNTIMDVNSSLADVDYHYMIRGFKLDKDFSKNTIKSYLDHLDQYNLFFTAEDKEKISSQSKDGIFVLKKHENYYKNQESQQKDNELNDELYDYVVNFNCALVFKIFRIFQDKVNSNKNDLFSALDEITNFSLTFKNNTPKIDLDLVKLKEDSNDIEDNFVLTDDNYLEQIKKNIIFYITSSYLMDNYHQSFFDYTNYTVQKFKSYINRANKLVIDDVISSFAKGFMSNFDLGNRFFDAYEMDNIFPDAPKNQLSLGIEVFDLDDQLFIYEVLESSDAYKNQKIKFGDRITAFKLPGNNDFQALNSYNINTLKNKINYYHKDYKKIDVLIKRPKKFCSSKLSDYKEFQATLSYSFMDTPSKQRPTSYAFNIKNSIDDKRIKVGYLKLYSFYPKGPKNTASIYEDVYQELELLLAQNIQSLVIDLRSNPGGEASSMAKIINMFSEKNINQFSQIAVHSPIQSHNESKVGHFIIKDPFKTFQSIFDKKATLTELHYLPLVILVNRNSASASEALAHNFKINNRAIIVGDDRTLGKGTVQGYKFNYSYAISVTTSMFFGSDGSSIQKVGVKSDIIIPSYTIAYKNLYGYNNDNSLKNKSIQVPENSVQNLGFRDNNDINKLALLSFDRMKTNEVSSVVKDFIRYADLNKLSFDYFKYEILNRSSPRKKDSFLYETNFYKNLDRKNIFYKSMLTANLSDKFLKIIRANNKDIKDYFAPRLVDSDYTMSEALNIAADYFILCKNKKNKSQLEDNKFLGCK